jgi:hypothetical protein
VRGCGKLDSVKIARTVAALCLLTTAATIAGCGSHQPNRPTNRRTTSAPAPRPSAGPPIALQQKATLGNTVEATAFEYKQPSVTAGPSGPAGYTWGSADVQVCTLASAKTNVTVDWKTWSLRFADNSVVPANDKNDDAFPRPEYPFTSQPLAAGQCARGWITFSVPANSKPTTVQYQPHGFLASWKVS